MTKRLGRLGVVCLACGWMALHAGCGTSNGPATADGDMDFLPPPESLSGEFPLAMRDRAEAFGTPVTEAQFENVLFEFDRDTIRASEMPKIEEVATFMRNHPEVRLVVDGHCDERGDRDYNMTLGEYRALAVRATLIRLGVEPDRIQTRSFGEEKPQDPRSNEAAWRVNRRAEFILYRP